MLAAALLAAPALAAPPANDNFGNATVLTGPSGRVTGSNVDATEQPLEPNTGGANASVWYRWTAPTNGRFAFTANGSSFNASVGVYTGSSVSSLTWVAENYPTGVAEFDAVAAQTYRIVVNGRSAGDIGSIVLNWGPPPPPNDRGQGQGLRGTGAAVRGTNVGATKDYLEPNHAGNAGGHSIGYGWNAPQSGDVTIETTGSSFNTLLAVYGTLSNWNEPLASNDDAPGKTTSRVVLHVVQGQGIQIWIDGKNGATGSTVLTIDLAVPKPANDDFADAQVITGLSGSVDGTTTAAGTELDEPYHGGPYDGYGGASVWYSWTAPMTGPAVFTSSNPSFDSLMSVYTGTAVESLVTVKNGRSGRTSRASFFASAGTVYRIAIDGWLGFNGPITLSWVNSPPITNDSFANATTISGSVGDFTGLNVGATKEAGEPNHAGNTGGSSVWFNWTPGTSGRVSFATAGSLFDTLLGVYTGSAVNGLTLVAANDDAGGFDVSSKVEFIATAGVTYRIAVDGYEGAQEHVELHWNSFRPWNDDFGNVEGLYGLNDTWDGDNFLATKEAGEPNHAGNSGGASVWFGWSAPGTGTVTIDLSGSDFDTLLAVYGPALDFADLELIDSDNDSGDGSTSKVSFAVTAGDWLNIAVDGKNGAMGHIHISLSEVIQAPANDNFSAAQVVSGATGSTPGTNLGASEEAGEPEHAGNTGASVWYRWTAPATGTVTFKSTSSDSTLLALAVYRGTNVSSLTLVANEGYSPSDFESRATFSAVSGTTYRIAVAGIQLPDDPAFGTFSFSWNQVGPPPANDFFVGATVLSGVSGTVSGDSTKAGREEGEPGNPVPLCIGEASVWYRWTAPATGVAHFDTNDSAFDTTLAVYTGSSVSSLTRITYDDDSGESWWSSVTFQATEGTTYSIAIDKCGFEGGAYELHVNPEAPANDSFASAQALTGYSGSAPGTNMWATKEPNEPQHADNSGGASTWYTWTAPADGIASFDTSGSSIDTLLAVYTGSPVGSLVEVAADDNSGGNFDSAVDFVAAEGTTYRIAVDGYNDPDLGVDMGSYSIHWALRPVNDDFSARASLTDPSVAGSTMGATAEIGEPAHAGAGAASSVWFSWTAPGDGTVTFDTEGSEIDTRLAVYTGANINDLKEVASDDDAAGGGASRTSFSASADATYAVVVDGGPGAFQLHWAMPPVSVPVSALRMGTVSSKGAPIRIQWTAEAQVDSYDLERKSPAGAWIQLASPTATQVDSLLPTGPTQLQVRAVQSGSPSAWATGGEFALAAKQETAGAIAYKGGWTTVRTSSAYGGGLRRSSAAGATAKISFSGEIGLVAPRGPAEGKAAILIDGTRVATVDLYSPRLLPRRLLFSWKADDSDPHMLTYRGLGTKNARSTGTRVDLDAFMLLG